MGRTGFRMEKFPTEFHDLLSARARSLTRPQAFAQSSFREQKTRMAWFPFLVNPTTVSHSIGLLERHMDPLLKSDNRPIPIESITEMQEDYSDSLPKTVSNRMVTLNSATSAATRKAKEIGLLSMMRSDSLRHFAEQVTGFKLDRDPGCQVIFNGHGDYTGPHNDHHPEEPHLRDGYIDVHITFSTAAVDHQWLVYEHQGYFSEIMNVGVRSGVTIYHLPFWHYTTPLVAKKGRERQARRWLLLTSFTIDER